MRLLILLFLGLLILTVLIVSDFILVRLIKEKIKALNSSAQTAANISPINVPSIIIAVLLFWLLPITMLPGEIRLEYRVFLTIGYWLLLMVTANWYYQKKLQGKLTRQLLSFLVIIAFCFGAIIVPIVVLIRENSSWLF